MSWQPAAARYEGMVYNRCGRSGLRLPAISLGLWHNFGGGSAGENARAMIRRAFDLGITHFDLANNYGPPPGAAEETFGRVLASDLESHRDELVVSTKAGYEMWPGPYGDGGSRKYLLASLDQSLARMGLDYVDVFYSHRPDPETPLEETMAALDRAVRAGKALYAGISSYPAERTAQAASLLRALGTPNVFSASTVDQMPKHVSAGLMFGTMISIPVPDVDRTDHLLVLGANPVASNGSLMTAPDVAHRLKAIRARGGRGRWRARRPHHDAVPLLEACARHPPRHVRQPRAPRQCR